MIQLTENATPLEVAQYVQHRLRLYTCIAGGSARDVWHGREPKDFDLLVLCGDAVTEDVEDLAAHARRAVLEDIPEATDVNAYFTYRDQKAGSIAYCIKFNVDGVAFDLIEHMLCCTTPKKQVENFDCTLNMAWFIEDEDGALQVVTHPRFNETVRTGCVRHLSSIDGDIERRWEYLRGKYPEYVYLLPSKPTGAVQ